MRLSSLSLQRALNARARTCRPRLAARRAAWPSALVCIALLGWCAAPARAADVLEIPSSCGSQSELTREVDALRASADTQPPARPEVRLAAQGDEYVLQVALPDGVRTLRDHDCRALFRAAIVIAALGQERAADALLDARTETQTAPPPPDPAAVLAAPPLVATPAGNPTPHAEPTVAAAPQRPAPRARPDAQAHAFGQVELAYGVVPAFSAALSLGVAWRRGLWGFRAWYGYLTPRTHEQAEQAVRIQGLDVALSLELVPLEWLSVGLGADLFCLRGQGLGVNNARVDWTVQPAPHLALRARVLSRGRLGLELTGRALWSPKPSSFALAGGDDLYTAAQFGFQAGLALRVQFL